MPKIASEVQFAFADKLFSIDGEEFPWYMDDPKIEVDPDTGVTKVTISLIAVDRVVINGRTVVDSGYTADAV